MNFRVPSLCRTLYWRARQRRADVRPWDDLLAAGRFDGASLAIVGNAGYLRQGTLGSTIDAHDLVLRMNDFPVGEYPEAVGSRLDIFMTSFASEIANLDEPAVRQTPFVVSSRPNNFRRRRLQGVRHVFGRNVAAGMARMRRAPVYVPPLDLFRDYTSLLGTYPTTGAMAVLLALDVLIERCGPVFIAGFSFFQGQGHYYSNEPVDARQNHNVDGERDLFRRRLAEPVRRGRVSLDPVMAALLWPSASRPLRRCA
ncbi:MAG: glycosyltransferase family 29 protein [Pirellulales bacterium]|nr:glycosyltransferase family 29 protein [Pirellulales bacterium]